MHCRSWETLSLGLSSFETNTNNDAGSHAVKLQVDQTVVVSEVLSVRSAHMIGMCMENADPSHCVNTNEY